MARVVQAAALVAVFVLTQAQAGAGNAAADNQSASGTLSRSWRILGADECARWIQEQGTLKYNLDRRCRANFATLRTVSDEIRFALTDIDGTLFRVGAQCALLPLTFFGAFVVSGPRFQLGRATRPTRRNTSKNSPSGRRSTVAPFAFS